jgi:opacity protein-like surface antigen
VAQGGRRFVFGDRIMRLSATLLAAVAVITPGFVLAADYPALPEAPVLDQPVGANWGGLYGGIHVGYSSSTMNTQNSAVDLATQAYRNSSAQALATSIAYLPTDFSAQTPSYGGFIGANWVWDDVVLGLEAEYSGFNPTMKDSGSYAAARYTGTPGQPGYQAVDFSATATTKLTSYGILKVRAGYAMGRLLPFATLGLAVGRGEVNATYTSFYSDNNFQNVPLNAASKHSGYMVGGSAGVGVDWLITDNVFARAEYTYVGFADFHGMSTTLHTIKAGIGIKY